jgi:hypothetical protein
MTLIPAVRSFPRPRMIKMTAVRDTAIKMSTMANSHLEKIAHQYTEEMKRCLYRRAGIHMDQQAKRGAERRKKELT